MPTTPNLCLEYIFFSFYSFLIQHAPPERGPLKTLRYGPDPKQPYSARAFECWPSGHNTARPHLCNNATHFLSQDICKTTPEISLFSHVAGCLSHTFFLLNARYIADARNMGYVDGRWNARPSKLTLCLETYARHREISRTATVNVGAATYLSRTITYCAAVSPCFTIIWHVQHRLNIWLSTGLILPINATPSYPLRDSANVAVWFE